jgi:hypothetical protein
MSFNPNFTITNRMTQAIRLQRRGVQGSTRARTQRGAEKWLLYS